MVGSEDVLAGLGFACLTHEFVVAFSKSLKVHEFGLLEDKFSQSEPFQAGFPLTAGSWKTLESPPKPQQCHTHPNPLHSLQECCVLGFVVYSWFFLGSSSCSSWHFV